VVQLSWGFNARKFECVLGWSLNQLEKVGFGGRADSNSISFGCCIDTGSLWFQFNQHVLLGSHDANALRHAQQYEDIVVAAADGYSHCTKLVRLLSGDFHHIHQHDNIAVTFRVSINGDPFFCFIKLEVLGFAYFGTHFSPLVREI